MSSNLPSINTVAQILGGSAMTGHGPHTQRWVGLPDKAQLDSDGEVVRASYTPVLQFVARQVAHAFSWCAIKTLLEIHPIAFQIEPAS
jgi:hypothetical protein